jgi:hypothetical protein
MARARRKRNVPLPTLQLSSEITEAFKHLQPQNVSRAAAVSISQAERIDRANSCQIFGPHPHETLTNRAVTALEGMAGKMVAPQSKQRRPGSGRKAIYDAATRERILEKRRELKRTRPDIQKPLAVAATVMELLKLEGEWRRADRVIRPECYRRANRPK